MTDVDCATCGGRGCRSCLGTGRAASGPACGCGHAESHHHRGECIVDIGPGAWELCPCERFRAEGA